MADIPARLFQYPHNIGAGTVEMSVQSPFEPAGKVPNSPRLTVVFI